MNWLGSLATLAILAAGSADVLACRRIPPIIIPSNSELAAGSELVFIARIERVLPLGIADDELVRSGFANVPTNTPIRMLTASTEFSFVRSLKGAPLMHSMMESATTSCGTILQEGSEYLIFANNPASADDEVVPLRGTFKLDGSQQAQASLAEVESSFSFPHSVQP
ncbi:MAG: hypothetical protein ABI538_03165 [Pseudoxanthomonas sp.]